MEPFFLFRIKSWDISRNNPQCSDVIISLKPIIPHFMTMVNILNEQNMKLIFEIHTCVTLH